MCLKHLLSYVIFERIKAIRVKTFVAFFVSIVILLIYDEEKDEPFMIEYL